MEIDFVVLGDDVVDDLVIWIYEKYLEKSKLIMINKKLGFIVYDLDGKQFYFYEFGKFNNVDLCYDFLLNGEKIDIVVVFNWFEGKNIIEVYVMDGDKGNLKSIIDLKYFIFSDIFEVYGFSLYYSQKIGVFYVLVIGK